MCGALPLCGSCVCPFPRTSGAGRDTHPEKIFPRLGIFHTLLLLGLCLRHPTNLQAFPSFQQHRASAYGPFRKPYPFPRRCRKNIRASLGFFCVALPRALNQQKVMQQTTQKVTVQPAKQDMEGVTSDHMAADFWQLEQLSAKHSA